MYADLRDKVAVITGAAGNLGRAMARRLLAEQVKLVLTDRSEEGLLRSVEALGADDHSCLWQSVTPPGLNQHTLNAGVAAVVSAAPCHDQ